MDFCTQTTLNIDDTVMAGLKPEAARVKVARCPKWSKGHCALLGIPEKQCGVWPMFHNGSARVDGIGDGIR